MQGRLASLTVSARSDSRWDEAMFTKVLQLANRQKHRAEHATLQRPNVSKCSACEYRKADCTILRPLSMSNIQRFRRWNPEQCQGTEEEECIVYADLAQV